MDWLAFGVAFFFLNVCGIFLYLKYYTFGYSDWDLAFYSQAMWNLSLHGGQYSSLFASNLFGNHSNLIAFLLVPLYWLFPHPLTLILTKVLVFVLAALIFYRYAKSKIGDVAALICMVLYLLYPANLFSLIYEFDFESLSPIFLFLLYIFYTGKNFPAFLSTAILTILIKENMALIVCAFGVAGLFSKEKWKWGGIPLVLGAALFLYLTQVFIPQFSKTGKHIYLYIYSGLGQTPLQIAWKLLTTPSIILGYLTPWNVGCLLKMLTPLALTPLFSLPTLFFAMPILLIRILADAPAQMTIYYYYGVSIAPFLFLAMVNALAWVRNKPRRIFVIFFHLLLILVVVCSIQDLRLYINSMKRMIFLHDDHFKMARWDLVKSIPKDAPVIATFDFLAELSQRKNLFAFFLIYHRNFGPNDFHLPAPDSFALIDFMDQWLLNSLEMDPKPTANAIHNFFRNNDWNVVKAYNDVVLLKKSATSCENCLLEVEDKPFLPSQSSPIIFDDTLELHNFQNITIKAHEESPPSCLTFFWRTAKDVNRLYVMEITLRHGKRRVSQHMHCIGYTMFPTALWKNDTYIKENYWLWLPHLPKGEYTIEIAVFGQVKESYARVPVKFGDSIESVVRMPLVIN